jgi:RHS repeat-associated protein
VVALSNINGDIVERYSYKVFGTPTIRDANSQELTISDYDNPYMFTGRRYDSETITQFFPGLYYYRARYYDGFPFLHRFLQPDPIGYYYSMNLYEY